MPTGDEFNSSLSDDIEPTSLTECADIRPGDSVCSGWGFLFLNLQRAFVAMLGGSYPDAPPGSSMAPSLLTIATPTNREVVDVTKKISVSWVLLGTAAESFTIELLAAGAMSGSVNVRGGVYV